MKKFIYFLVPAIAIGFIAFKSPMYQKSVNWLNNVQQPVLQEQEREKRDPNKNRSWSAEEAEANATTLELVQQSITAGKSLLAKNAKAFTDVSQLGKWISKGPFNMPGAFQFCEVDEGTDDVYAVSCGHYGGVQFIWKGTLAGDNWKIINPKNPSRFEDLIAIPNGSNRRIIAGHERGRVMYTDNAGQTWTYSTGIPSGIFSTIVNRQDNSVIYATNGKIVYRSTDKGTSFSAFYTIGTANANSARLYSPRWNNQPNAIDVYMAVDNRFFKMNAGKTSFDVINSSIATGGRIGIGGDSRKLWLTIDNKWYYSTNVGQSFTYQSTKDYYYGAESEGMNTGQHLGINPTNPNIIIGGYAHPLSSRNGGVNQNNDAQNYWGWYQNAVGNDNKVRINYHPDMQASQFFYDKTGRLLSLRSSDGGVFRSYNEWEKTSFPDGASIQSVFYNISLYGQPTQETYRGGFIIGKNNLNDLTVGTQDQGWQNTRLSTYNAPVLSWDQVGGGDGPCCITGDGLIGWKMDYFARNFTRINLYNGTIYSGLAGSASAEKVFPFTGGGYFTPLVGDWSDGNRAWALSQTLRRVEYNTSSGEITGKEDNLANSTNYIQGIAQSRVNPSVVYALHNGIVFKSTNKGTNWSQIAAQGATGVSGSGDNRGMGWSSPLDEKIVLFASQSGTAVKTIFSKNGGTTWTNVTGSGANLFPNAEVNGMAGTADGKLVFASTNMGPYVFIIAEEKWYPLAIQSDMPIFWGQIVYCQKYNGKEYARFSTWGQGVWDFEIATTTINPTNTTISLRGNNNKYVCSENGLIDMTCNRAAVGTWEKFEVVTVNAGKVALKGNNGKYVCSENGARNITCNRSIIGDWEQFTIIDAGGGAIALQGNNGKYLSSQNGTVPMTCNSTTIGQYEKFFKQAQTLQPTAAITEEVVENSINKIVMYPNPIENGELSLKGFSPTETYELSITNLNGNVLFSEKINSAKEQKIDLNHKFPSGIYIVNVRSKEFNKTLRLVVK
jgi:Secretion system C-terminal sorting domain/FRG1-like domain